MLIRNINVYGYENQDGSASLKSVYITETGEALILDNDSTPPEIPKTEINAKGIYSLMPGLLDSHVHGQGGPDFADVGESPDSLHTITTALGKTGLAYAMATLVSLALPTLKKSLAAINAYVKEQERQPTPGATQIVGIHLEGPFIAENCRGAHAESALQSSISLEQFKDIIHAAPDIKEWKLTLAPDLPGAQDFIKDVKRLEEDGIYVKVFIGHSNPKEKAAIGHAVQAGAVGFTHLGNACQETCCRETRALETSDATSHVVQWVLENPQACPSGVELIVDGVHLSQSFVLLVQKIIGDKIVLVTDALGPSGLEEGQYKLGTLAIRKEKNNFYLVNEESGEFIMKPGKLPNGKPGQVKSLAGSAAPLSFCMEKYIECIAELDETTERKMQALYAATILNPRVTSLSYASIAKLPDNKNFVILDNNGKLVFSLCNGKIMEHQEGWLSLEEKKTSLLVKQGLITSKNKKSEKTLTSSMKNPNTNGKPKNI